MRESPGSSLRKHCAALAVGLAACFGVAAQAPAPQGAASAPTGGDRNIYTAGGQVRPAGPVPGDFAGAGARVIVDQPVGGDASVAGASVDVRAPVGDDVRAVGGDVSIESTVGGELFATGGNITLTRGAGIARAASLYGSNIRMEGRIDGDLKASGQKVTINGAVGGNVRVTAEQLELGPAARIAGDLSYASGTELRRSGGAVVGGSITRERRDGAGPEGGGPGGQRQWEHSIRGPAWLAGLAAYLALLACAAVFLLVLPGFAAQAPERIRASPWLALAIGFATLVAVPMLAVLLFVTLLGIPLGLAVLALYPVLLLAGFVVGVLFIAREIPPALRQARPLLFPRVMAYFALALLLVLLLGSLPLVGGLVIGAVSVWGTGACVLELHGRRKEAAAA